MKYKVILPTPSQLRMLEPCTEALIWLETQPDLLAAWEVCPRCDWMLWLLGATDQLPYMLSLALQLVVLETPLANGKKVIDLITDDRSLAFIDMKRRRLAGEVISDEDWDNGRIDATAATAAAEYAAATDAAAAATDAAAADAAEYAAAEYAAVAAADAAAVDYAAEYAAEYAAVAAAVDYAAAAADYAATATAADYAAAAAAAAATDAAAATAAASNFQANKLRDLVTVSL